MLMTVCHWAVGEGRVYTWGDGMHGQLALGEGRDSAHVPTIVPYGPTTQNDGRMGFLTDIVAL